MRFFIILTSATLLLCSSIDASAQDTINKTDARGLKQGYWVKRYTNGKRQYEGWFRDNKPAGIFKRYFENDSLMSVLDHKPDGKTVDATMYHTNGNLASKGVFINQKKEGKWIFYSKAIEDYLLVEEYYQSDLKEGLSTKFYPSGAILEKIYYVKDKKHGEWSQYYPDGKLCLKANYENGKLEGKFEAWFPTGKYMMQGQYKNDGRNGQWLIYSKDGKLKGKEDYINGIPLNPDRLKKESEYLDKLDKNRGLIEDPEKSESIWQR